MDPQVIPFVKEEIIRNIIKSHNSLLVTGWQKSGKSLSALKAAMSIADTYYFDPLGRLPLQEIAERSASSEIRPFVDSIKPADEMFSLLVVDNYEKLTPADKEFIRSLLLEKRIGLKIILISGAFGNISSMVQGIEAVVRIKTDTAELIYTLKS
ncbi:MAG: hypothetical protein JXR79_07985 [Nitrospirae bacterium]|nr:hypothetical protein [Nitrospirota bacterium]